MAFDPGPDKTSGEGFRMSSQLPPSRSTLKGHTRGCQSSPPSPTHRATTHHYSPLITRQHTSLSSASLPFSPVSDPAPLILRLSYCATASAANQEVPAIQQQVAKTRPFHAPLLSASLRLTSNTSTSTNTSFTNPGLSTGITRSFVPIIA